MTTQTPARLYAVVVGAVLLIAAIIGFAHSPRSDPGGDVDSVLGILDVNAWHNVVHIATGALGLVFYRAAPGEYALGLGAVYLVVAPWGFIIGDGESTSDSYRSTPRTTSAMPRSPRPIVDQADWTPPRHLSCPIEDTVEPAGHGARRPGEGS